MTRASKKQKQTLADQVAQRIVKEHLEPRSQSSLLIEQLGHLSLVLVSLASVVLLVNWTVFQFRTSGVLEFTRYGGEGYRAVLEAMPYGFFLLCLAGIGLALLAIRHFDISYRKPLIVLTGVLAFSIGLGSLLAVSGVNERLAEQADQGDTPKTIVHRLYRGRLATHHHSTTLIIGPVVGQSDNKLRIVIPPQRLVEVATDPTTQYPLGKPTVGDRVRVLVIRQAGMPLARVILLGPGKRLLPPIEQQ